MRPTFVVEAEVAGTQSAVWDALTDWDTAHEWMGGIESLSAAGPTEAGAQLTFHARGKDRPSSIASLNPGNSIVLRSIQGGVTADYVYELRPGANQSTIVRLSATCATKGFYRLLTPLLGFAVRRADSGQMASFKTWFEAR